MRCVCVCVRASHNTLNLAKQKLHADSFSFFSHLDFQSGLAIRVGGKTKQNHLGIYQDLPSY